MTLSQVCPGCPSEHLLGLACLPGPSGSCLPFTLTGSYMSRDRDPCSSSCLIRISLATASLSRVVLALLTGGVR
ncbi:hypothetical protein QBC46DRAFT_383121 [Diplogelasinospora grovesii]|uniref:Uncharacterized protein n=1 Tax=Diplogelasinospora grovesii TaxID=303347 RepID=A0AAN6N8P8_9PEZI|nr:hypothetical protein QBC46DRAFT_383121 [Diplogelasinospora grovesii]